MINQTRQNPIWIYGGGDSQLLLEVLGCSNIYHDSQTVSAGGPFVFDFLWQKKDRCT